MNILIIGSGGREHALGWKLKQSKLCDRLFFAPGNGGTDQIGQNVSLAFDPVDTKHADAIDYFCRQNKVELIVIGPEDPLADACVALVVVGCSKIAKLLADGIKNPEQVCTDLNYC